MYILSLSIISLYDSCFDNHCMPSCLSSSVATVRSFGSTSGLSVGSSDCWGYLAFSTMTHHMGVSKNRVFPTKSSHSNRVFHYKYKPSMLGYQHSWKHPYLVPAKVESCCICLREKNSKNLAVFSNWQEISTKDPMKTYGNRVWQRS